MVRRLQSTRAYIVLALLCLAACARHNNQLITSSGTYTAPEGKLVLEIAAPDPSHLGFRVDWKTALKSGASSLFSLGSTQAPFHSVAAGHWAFCIVSADEVWFFNDGIYSQYKGRGNELVVTQSCNDPALADRAPEVLKNWAINPKVARR